MRPPHSLLLGYKKMKKNPHHFLELINELTLEAISLSVEKCWLEAELKQWKRVSKRRQIVLGY